MMFLEKLSNFLTVCKKDKKGEFMEEIKKCADEVFNTLGIYQKECVYEEALMHEFRLRGIRYERQKSIEIIYKGYKVGKKTPDCILYPEKDKQILLEIKSSSKIEKRHEKQVKVYLVSLNLESGYLLNFNTKTGKVDLVEVKRPSRKYITDKVYTPSKKRVEDDNLFPILREIASEVMDFFGSEFFYHNTREGLGIFIEALGVELRLRGFSYQTQVFQLLYKDHHVSDFTFEFKLSTGQFIKILSYRNNEELKDKLEELKFYKEYFSLVSNDIYAIALPQNENNEIVVEKI